MSRDRQSSQSLASRHRSFLSFIVASHTHRCLSYAEQSDGVSSAPLQYSSVPVSRRCPLSWHRAAKLKLDSVLSRNSRIATDFCFCFLVASRPVRVRVQVSARSRVCVWGGENGEWEEKEMTAVVLCKHSTQHTAHAHCHIAHATLYVVHCHHCTWYTATTAHCT